jgi:hypothetical protein
MANLATQTINRAGLNATYSAAASGGDTFTPGSNVFIHVKNGHTSAQTVTVVTPGTTFGQAISDVAVSVPNAGERIIGPFPAQHFADPTDGLADLTYSGVTALTLAILELA